MFRLNLITSQSQTPMCVCVPNNKRFRVVGIGNINLHIYRNRSSTHTRPDQARQASRRRWMGKVLMGFITRDKTHHESLAQGKSLDLMHYIPFTIRSS